METSFQYGKDIDIADRTELETFKRLGGLFNNHDGGQQQHKRHRNRSTNDDGGELQREANEKNQ